MGVFKVIEGPIHIATVATVIALTIITLIDFSIAVDKLLLGEG